MASFEITWRKSTKRDLRKLSKDVVRRVIEKVESLAENPQPVDSVKLTNSACAYRIRVGNYRIVYEVWEDEGSIEIQRVRHRRDVYRK